MKRRARKQQQKNMLPVILILAGVVLALGLLIWQIARSAGGQTSQPPGSSSVMSNIERVSLADAKQAFDQKQAVFLDVRPADSYAAGHIPGSLNIPLAELGTRINELDPNQWIITYCT